MMHKFAIVLGLLALLSACDVGLIPEVQQEPALEAERVRPLDLLPENADELRAELVPPGPVDDRDPNFPPKQVVTDDRPRIAELRVSPAVARVGEPVMIEAVLGGNWRPLLGKITAHLNLNHLVFPIVVGMNDEGRDGDREAGDGIFTYFLQVPEDALSQNLKIYAAAATPALSLGIAGAYLVITGGDFQSRHGFEAADCPLDKPFVFPEQIEESNKLRGYNLKDGLWTIQNGWVGKEAALEGQFGLNLNQGGVFLSRWFANGVRLTYRTQEENGAALGLAWSVDGVRWNKLHPRREPHPKGGWKYSIDLPERFSGYLRWLLVSGGPVRLDQIRVWQKTSP